MSAVLDIPTYLKMVFIFLKLDFMFFKLDLPFLKLVFIFLKLDFIFFKLVFIFLNLRLKRCRCKMFYYQYNALWAKNERAQERCRRVSCTCHVG